MHSAQPSHHLMPGTQIEVIGIGEDDLRANFRACLVGADALQHILRDRLHRRLRAYGHEDRRLHIAMGQPQHTAPSAAGRALAHHKAQRHASSMPVAALSHAVPNSVYGCSASATACVTSILFGTREKPECSACSFCAIVLKKIARPLISVFSSAVFQSGGSSGSRVVAKLLPARMVAKSPKPMLTSWGSFPAMECRRSAFASMSTVPDMPCSTRSSIDCGPYAGSGAKSICS